MTIKIKNKEVELKYTYNSFRYMEELNLGELESLERTPFKILGILETLLLGAINHNPKVKYTQNDVVKYLDSNMEDINLIELLEKLTTLLEKSSFFQSLQK